ncbi:AzlD domain-containing protein [Chitinibacter tainanensis]|uniref:AzlD domain-containing protein n=1 Tax=Chitinibacter tainanensis TaxID=230667 RepID=UPI00040C3058|nr:AzlD domain-containing protein [Chitinibacter tainanensis]
MSILAMSIPEIVLMLLGMAVVTYGLRVLGFIPGMAARLPARVQQALAFVPVAVLTAIVLPEVLHGPTGWRWTLANPALWGMLATALIMARTRRLMAAIAVGMLVFYLLRALWGA